MQLFSSYDVDRFRKIKTHLKKNISWTQAKNGDFLVVLTRIKDDNGFIAYSQDGAEDRVLLHRTKSKFTAVAMVALLDTLKLYSIQELRDADVEFLSLDELAYLYVSDTLGGGIDMRNAYKLLNPEPMLGWLDYYARSHGRSFDVFNESLTGYEITNALKGAITKCINMYSTPRAA